MNTELFKKTSLTACAVLLVLAIAVVVPRETDAAVVMQPNILVGSDMTIGSTGPSVVMLQGLLAEQGYLTVPMGVPLGYYGSLTRDAVARYQAARGVSPTAGYFGPRTRSAMEKHFESHGWLDVLGW